MSRFTEALREWLRPGSVSHASLRPMDMGLRPNSLLDEARDLLTGERPPVDDVTFSDGEIWVSAQTTVFRLEAGLLHPVAELGGRVGPLIPCVDGVIAAVEGRGIVRVSDDAITDVCNDPVVLHGVTDLEVIDDDEYLVAVGARHVSEGGWGAALLAGDRSGYLTRVLRGRASIVADGLAWPSGVSIDVSDHVLLSLSFDHRIERRPLGALGHRGEGVLDNLPMYPGRIGREPAGWWVAAPYVRNRVSELFLDEPGFCSEMQAEIAPAEWPIPQLRSDNPYTSPMQTGQLRVLGVVKPWAPPRSYGLAFHFDQSGMISKSYHSRTDGHCHGVTGIAEHQGAVIAAVQGARALVQLEGT
jgi:hypothetical protein